MKLKNNLWKFIVLVLVILGIAAGAFFIGRNNGKISAEKVFQEERDLNIRLKRAELEQIKLVDGPIYVIGHKAPDSDTVCSSIAYANLLRELGYDAQAAVQGPVNHETAYILETAGVEVPPLLEETAGKNIVLVDHSEYAQSADDLKDANIISIIDHHGVGSVTTGNQLIYDARPLGGTCTIIWMRYRDYGVEITPSIATLLLGGFLSDTANLRPTSATAADTEAYKALGAISDVKDLNAFYQEMYKASISYKGMSDEEIFRSDMKLYDTAGRSYAIAVVNAYDDAAAEDYAQRMKTLMPDLIEPLGVDMIIAQVSIYHDDISKTYLVGGNTLTDEVLAAAFPDRAVFDGTSYVLEPGISRKSVLVPAITEVLSAHPTE